MVVGFVVGLLVVRCECLPPDPLPPIAPDRCRPFLAMQLQGVGRQAGAARPAQGAAAGAWAPGAAGAPSHRSRPSSSRAAISS